MKRQIIRLCLAVLLVGVTVVAAMLWSASYSKETDPAAVFEIVSAKVRKDESFYWLELHLKKTGEEDHDLRKPVRLITGGGMEHDAADTIFAGNPEEGFTEIWFKFWIEENEIGKTVSLKINDGILSVKTNEGLPELDKDGEAVIKSEDWSESWLGF